MVSVAVLVPVALLVLVLVTVGEEADTVEKGQRR